VEKVGIDDACIFTASTTPAMPDFCDAYRTQLVLDAIAESAREGR
jgi:hypothetical protein